MRHATHNTRRRLSAFLDNAGAELAAFACLAYSAALISATLAGGL